MTNTNKKIVVDACDFEWLSEFTWSITSDGYPITSIKGKVKGIGPLILGTKKGMIADHIDGDQLNNSRKNLRVCTKNQSAQNRGGWKKKKIKYKGVHFDRARNQYRALITANGVRKQSRRYDTSREAALAYDRMAREFHGLFARTNFL
jgi:hypothetical protein